jgi:hypothetical protein
VNATGHVKLVHRKRGPVFYVKYRQPDGRQVERKLGPAWAGPGRPPAGHYTRRTADETLAAILTEWLRYVQHDRRRRPSTVRDYRNTTEARLVPEFGDDPIEAIGPDRIDRWRSRLLAEPSHHQQVAGDPARDLQAGHARVQPADQPRSRCRAPAAVSLG